MFATEEYIAIVLCTAFVLALILIVVSIVVGVKLHNRKQKLKVAALLKVEAEQNTEKK